MIKILILPLLIITLTQSVTQIKPSLLSPKFYQQTISKQLKNTHYFIITSRKLLTETLLKTLTQYSATHSIQLYECSPTQHKDICQLDDELFLIINTVKIDYNGRPGHQQDFIKWVKFRVEEYPQRVHSIQELKQFVKGKNQIFCFVDRQGQEITRKQYIFIGTAKKFHFLHYCNIDVSIAKQLHLKQGHLVLVRNDLTHSVDYWSDKLPQNTIQLHQIWSNFLIKSCQSDFRLQNKDKTHDVVIFQCDLSLQCEQELYTIFKYELEWRKKHPQLNYKIFLLYGKQGQRKASDDKYQDYPIIKYGKTVIKKQIIHQNTGAVLQQTRYQRDLYLQTDPVINQSTIQVLLTLYNDKKLKYQYMEEEMDIRPLEAEEAHPHREEKKRREREEKGEQGETNRDMQNKKGEDL